MIGMPKSMMQEEMQPLGPAIKKSKPLTIGSLQIGGTAPLSPEAQFERGDHGPLTFMGVPVVFNESMEGGMPFAFVSPAENMTLARQAKERRDFSAMANFWREQCELERRRVAYAEDECMRLQAEVSRLKEQAKPQSDVASFAEKMRGDMEKPLTFQGIPVIFNESFEVLGKTATEVQMRREAVMKRGTAFENVPVHFTSRLIPPEGEVMSIDGGLWRVTGHNTSGFFAVKESRSGGVIVGVVG